MLYYFCSFWFRLIALSMLSGIPFSAVWLLTAFWQLWGRELLLSRRSQSWSHSAGRDPYRRCKILPLWCPECTNPCRIFHQSEFSILLWSWLVFVSGEPHLTFFFCFTTMGQNWRGGVSASRLNFASLFLASVLMAALLSQKILWLRKFGTFLTSMLIYSITVIRTVFLGLFRESGSVSKLFSRRQKPRQHFIAHYPEC